MSVKRSLWQALGLGILAITLNGSSALADIRIYMASNAPSGLNYTLNGSSYTMYQGYEQNFAYDRDWSLSFYGSGGDLKTYTISDGTYYFAYDQAAGWDLKREVAAGDYARELELYQSNQAQSYVPDTSTYQQYNYSNQQSYSTPQNYSYQQGYSAPQNYSYSQGYSSPQNYSYSQNYSSPQNYSYGSRSSGYSGGSGFGGMGGGYATPGRSGGGIQIRVDRNGMRTQVPYNGGGGGGGRPSGGRRFR
jgi:hypothetical protein